MNDIILDLPQLNVITFGKHFAVNMNTDFELSSLPNLESVYIGAGSFLNLKSFTLSHNPKLSVFEIEDGYMKDDGRVCDCAFLKVYELKLIGMY